MKPDVQVETHQSSRRSTESPERKFGVRDFQLPSQIVLDRARAREQVLGRSWDELKNWPELELEIGCGVGWHSLIRAFHLSQDHERRRGLVAIERTREKFSAFARRLARHPAEKVTHLAAVHADARIWCAREVDKPIFDHVWILYPNPEPSRPQRNWIREPFFAVLSRAVKSGGRLTLATNSRSYFNDAIEASLLWEASWQIGSRRSWSNQTESDFLPRSHFEKKYFERGELLFELELIRLPARNV